MSKIDFEMDEHLRKNIYDPETWNYIISSNKKSVASHLKTIFENLSITTLSVLDIIKNINIDAYVYITTNFKFLFKVKPFKKRINTRAMVNSFMYFLENSKNISLNGEEWKYVITKK